MAYFILVRNERALSQKTTAHEPAQLTAFALNALLVRPHQTPIIKLLSHQLASKQSHDRQCYMLARNPSTMAARF